MLVWVAGWLKASVMISKKTKCADNETELVLLSFLNLNSLL